MKIFFAWLCGCVVAMQPTAVCAMIAATARAESGIQVSSVTLSSAGSELAISFLDSAPVPHACDYYVSRFEYVEVEPGLLVIQLRSPEPCLVDRYGRRTGTLKWTIPSKLRGSGRLTVIVNDRDAGELQLSGSGVNFISH